MCIVHSYEIPMRVRFEWIEWNANQNGEERKKNVIGSWKVIALLCYNGVVNWQEKGEEKSHKIKVDGMWKIVDGM